MRKEIVNFILLVLLISGSIISWVMISQYRAEILRLNQVSALVEQRYQEAQAEIDQLSSHTGESTTLPLQDVQIPITGNPTFSSMEAQITESQEQIKALEMVIGQRKMCEMYIEDLEISSLDSVNKTIENFINENNGNQARNGYWVTIWYYNYDITEHGFYGDGGLFWYYLVYRDSYTPGIYSVEESCWIYSE
jgi:hypothetical protein